MYNAAYFPELASASQALNQEQKKWILKNMNRIPETKKIKMFDILIDEQMKLFDINKRRMGINNEYISKKTKIVNTYNENLVKLNEENILHQMDQELNNAFPV